MSRQRPTTRFKENIERRGRFPLWEHCNQINQWKMMTIGELPPLVVLHNAYTRAAVIPLSPWVEFTARFILPNGLCPVCVRCAMWVNKQGLSKSKNASVWIVFTGCKESRCVDIKNRKWYFNTDDLFTSVCSPRCVDCCVNSVKMCTTRVELNTSSRICAKLLSRYFD